MLEAARKMQNHPQILTNYLLIVSKDSVILSNKGLAFFATIGDTHRFWDLTRAGMVVKIKIADFPEWEENGYNFKIVQG